LLTALLSYAIFLILYVVKDLSQLKLGGDYLKYETIERVFETIGKLRYYPASHLREDGGDAIASGNQLAAAAQRCLHRDRYVIAVRGMPAIMRSREDGVHDGPLGGEELLDERGEAGSDRGFLRTDVVWAGARGR
jgi:hypothetical protein